MNCPKCNAVMIATINNAPDALISAVHTCPNCPNVTKFSFGKSDGYNHFAPTTKEDSKVVNRVGQVFTLNYMNETSHHYVIGQYKNHLGRQVYVLAWWDKVTSMFMSISEDSYHCEKGSFSTDDNVFGDGKEKVKATSEAMTRMYRLIRLMQKVLKKIREVGAGKFVTQQVIATTSYRGKFDIHDKLGYALMEAEPEFFAGNGALKSKWITLYKKLAAQLHEEKKLAGIN